MTRLIFAWRGLGHMGSADRYRREFPTAEQATEFRDRVLEGRGEAVWSVRTESGVLRRLGSADAASMVHLIERQREVA